jgi:hypothetical protein
MAGTVDIGILPVCRLDLSPDAGHPGFLRTLSMVTSILRGSVLPVRSPLPGSSTCVMVSNAWVVDGKAGKRQSVVNEGSSHAHVHRFHMLSAYKNTFCIDES